MSDDAIGITAISDLFSQCVIAVAKQVETELRRRGVTLKTADQWEQITYFQDPMTVNGEVLHKVECRSKNSGDWFRVCAMANSTVKCLRIVVETPATAAGNGDGDGSSSEAQR